MKTLTAERIAEMQQAKIEVAKMLGYSIEDIANIMYESGVQFLEEYFKLMPVMAYVLERDRMFWNWWKNEWHCRNLTFLHDAEIAMVCLDIKRHAYSALNNGIELTRRIKPTQVVYHGVLATLKHAQ